MSFLNRFLPLEFVWIGCEYLGGEKKSKKIKLINAKLVKFNCCKGGKMVKKWWKIKGALNFMG